MITTSITSFTVALCITLSLAEAWADRNSDQNEVTFDKEQAGQVAFVSSSGTLESDPSLFFDVEEGLTKMDKFSANTFLGDSINFRGREIRSAALINPSIEGLNHLSADSLSLRSQASSGKNGFGLAMIDKSGTVSAANHMRWDDKRKELKLPSLNTFSKSGLEIRSDLDLTSHELKNAKIAANTTLEKLNFHDGHIRNTFLHNVTATDLELGDVRMDSLSILSFHAAHAVGSFLSVGPENGAIEVSADLRKDVDGRLLVNNEIVFSQPIDFGGQDIANAIIKSGRIEGNVDLFVDGIDANTISLRNVRDDKTIISDGLASIGLDGKLKMSPIPLSSDGSIGNMKVHGTIDFANSANSKNNEVRPRGRIYGADISGGSIAGVEKLSVDGEADIGSGLQVTGESYFDGDLSVSGSVLGSGPYVDVSDRRLKKNISTISSRNALAKLIQLDGVSYELELPIHHRLGRRHNQNNANERKQFGFIAQDVEKLFPELVDIDEQNFRGLQYARFAPIIVEALKELHEMNIKLAHEVQALQALVSN